MSSIKYYTETLDNGAASFGEGFIIPDGATELPYGEWCDLLEKARNPPPQPLTVENLTAYAANKRWQVETGGILFQGLPVSTDRESQAMIGRTLQTMELTGKPVKFKTGAGFFEMDLDLMRGLSLEIAAHVQLCFETEAVISEKIEAGEIKTFEEIEVFEWPSNNA